MLKLPEVSLLGVKIRFIVKLSSFGVKNQHEQSFEITGKRETENLSRLIYYLETVKYFEVVRKSSGTNQVCPTMDGGKTSRNECLEHGRKWRRFSAYRPRNLV